MILLCAENGRLLMFGGNTWGQLGCGFKPAASKPALVRGTLLYTRTAANKDCNYRLMSQLFSQLII